MGKKIILEEVEESKRENKSFTASHIMLYIILGVYIAVSLAGLVFMGICIGTEKYEYIAQVFISEVSMVTGCSGVCVGFYANKAKRENELHIANAKYKMRLDLAKEIYVSNGVTLDDKSIQLLRLIISDKDVHIDENIEMPKVNIPDVTSSVNDNILNDDGVG